MKPFNLLAALAGAPVCTRKGKPVTQLHQFTLITGHNKLYGVIDNIRIVSWYQGGRCSNNLSHFYDEDDDLFMAPVKKKGWIGISMVNAGTRYLAQTTNIYPTKADALEYGGFSTAIEIEWEE